MSNNTLSLTQASYQLLESLNNENIGIGVDTDAYPSYDEANINNSVFARRDLENLNAYLGKGRDTLNVAGNVSGAHIVMDQQFYGNEGIDQGNDLLLLAKDLTSDKDFSSGGFEQRSNQIWMGGGNDTVRIGGQVVDTDVYLGSGNDSLVIGGDATNVYVAAGTGRDYLEFRGRAEDVIVQSGDHNDTVVFRKQLYGTGYNSRSNEEINTAAVHLGTGSDSLILADGASNAEINTGSGSDSIRLTGIFDNTWFHLDGSDSSNHPVNNNDLVGGDLITASSKSTFISSNFSSDNINGDTLIAGTNTTWNDSNLWLGSGNDSLVFGSGTSFFDATISLGGGADTLVFGSSTLFDNLTINLGSGTNLDTDLVRFNNLYDIKGATIKGADNTDILFIGQDKYYYGTGSTDSLISAVDQSERQDWMNGWYKTT